MMPEQLPLWAEQTNCAITVCDCDGIIIYMNERARVTFASHGARTAKFPEWWRFPWLWTHKCLITTEMPKRIKHLK